MPPRHPSWAALLAACLSLAGCGGARYTWVGDLQQREAPDEYVIASGDLVSVRVFNQDHLSTRARVRSDGKIAVPFLGDVELRGKTPAAVTRDLGARFKEFVVTPVVTLTVEETQPTSVAVLGEVSRPGNYTLDASSGVLQALAAAGGLTEYASRDAIYVVRNRPAQRVRFTFSWLVEGEGRAATFRLRAGDVVVVE